MGRWLEKIQKGSDSTPTKGDKRAFVGFVGSVSGTFPKNQAQEIDHDRLHTNMQALGKLLGMTPEELVERGVIEVADYPQLAAMTPDVVRVLAQVSAERLGVCIKVA